MDLGDIEHVEECFRLAILRACGGGRSDDPWTVRRRKDQVDAGAPHIDMSSPIWRMIADGIEPEPAIENGDPSSLVILLRSGPSPRSAREILARLIDPEGDFPFVARFVRSREGRPHKGSSDARPFTLTFWRDLLAPEALSQSRQFEFADLLDGKHADFRIEIGRRKAGKPPKVSHEAIMAAHHVISTIEPGDKLEGMIAVGAEKYGATRMSVRRRLKSLYGNIGNKLEKNATKRHLDKN